MAPGGPAVSEADWAVLVRSWFPQLTDTRLRQVTWGEIGRHRDYIAGQLKAGVTKATIHQRLADEHGLAASLASLKRYVAANLPEEARRAQVTVLRDTPPPGAEAQIDYGLLGTWADPSAGRRHRVQAFVMVLPCSRHMFVRPVLVMDQRAWTEAHVAAFGFFGGVPRQRLPGERDIPTRPLPHSTMITSQHQQGMRITASSIRQGSSFSQLDPRSIKRAGDRLKGPRLRQRDPWGSTTEQSPILHKYPSRPCPRMRASSRHQVAFDWLSSTRWPSGSRRKQRTSEPQSCGAVRKAAPRDRSAS
jgi:hypothetical protein